MSAKRVRWHRGGAVTRTVITRSWRRRFKSFVLRWQARLDAEWADRFLPWSLATGFSLVLFLLAAAQARGLEAGAGLASAVQGSWLIAHGHAADLTVPGHHLLASHFPIGMYPVGWLTLIMPTVPTLLALQAAGIGFGIVPLWRIARRLGELRVGATVALAVAFAASPMLNNLNLAGFHPGALAVTPLLAATYLALRERWWLFAAAAAGAVIWDAELALVVAGIGVLAIMRGNRRTGALIAAAGVAVTLLAVLVLEPAFGSAGFVAEGAYRDYGTNVAAVLGGMVLHPFRALGDLLAEGNVSLLVGSFAPLLFLPVLAPKFLIPAVPLQGLLLLADAPAARDAPELTLPLTVFTFVAATFALARLGRRGVERVAVDRRVLIALTAAAVGFFALAAGSSPYRRPWSWGSEMRDDKARHQVADRVPRELAVRASPQVLPLLARRPQLYQLGPGPDGVAAAQGVSAVVVDANVVAWTPREWLDFVVGLAGQGFRHAGTVEGVSLYLKSGVLEG